MIKIDELKNLMNRMAYARLLKDTKKAGINVSKLKMPERINSQLISARVRAMVKAVFDQIKIKAIKERYRFRWYVWVEEFEKVYRGNDYEFYKFFSAHPDMRKLEKRYSFGSYSGQYFTVFDNRERGYGDHILEYNPQLLEELRRYMEYVSAVFGIYPEIKRQWIENQKLTIQQKYDAIVSKKTREVKENEANQAQ